MSAIIIICIRLVICSVWFAAGLWLFYNPRKAIELQTAFYRLINWKMEPVSMAKEVRNTRIMAITVIILSSLAFFLILINNNT